MVWLFPPSGAISNGSLVEGSLKTGLQRKVELLSSSFLLILGSRSELLWAPTCSYCNMTPSPEAQIHGVCQFGTGTSIIIINPFLTNWLPQIFCYTNGKMANTEEWCMWIEEDWVEVEKKYRISNRIQTSNPYGKVVMIYVQTHLKLFQEILGKASVQYLQLWAHSPHNLISSHLKRSWDQPSASWLWEELLISYLSSC